MFRLEDVINIRKDQFVLITSFFCWQAFCLVELMIDISYFPTRPRVVVRLLVCIYGWARTK